MSAALKTPFQHGGGVPSPATLDTEVDIVRKRVGELAVNLELKANVPADEAIRQVVTIFPRAAHAGQTLDGKRQAPRPPIGACCPPPRRFPCWPNGMAPGRPTSRHGRRPPAHDLAAGLQGAVVKDEEKDKLVWRRIPVQCPQETRGRLAFLSTQPVAEHNA